MQSEMPFYESPEDALKACVEHLGGAKKVGAQLFPDKTIDNARDYLLACVNSDRNEKLSPSQIIFIFREAKLAGFHAGWNYWSGQAEYESKPITQQQQQDQLVSLIEKTVPLLAKAVSQLQKMQSERGQ